MKKHLRKLTLSRETIGILQGGDLSRVVAGSATSACCFFGTGCNCASRGDTDCYAPTLCFGTCSC